METEVMLPTRSDDDVAESHIGLLSGVRVLELGHFAAGPYATLVLADLGADVVRVEDPDHPDEARGVGPHWQAGESLYYLGINWGKRGVAVRWKTDEGRATILELARWADVVVANYRPGVLERFGIGLDRLREENDQLITCSVTAFGTTGPDARRPGYDYTIQAIGGVMSQAGEPGGPPAKAGISYLDHSGGLAAALAVVAALRERDRTGRGRHLDVGLLDVQTSMLTYLAAWSLNAGHEPARTPQSGHPTLVPAQNFVTADGWLSLFIGTDGMWARLVGALDEPVLRQPGFATNAGRADHRHDVIAALTRIFTTDTSAVWAARLVHAGVACAPVNDIATALAEPQVAARGLMIEADHPRYGRYRHVSGPLPTLSTRSRRGAPTLGEHNSEVLADLAGRLQPAPS